MSDWKNTNYGIPKSWEQQQREKAKADFERKYPSKWWHDAVFSIAGMAIILGLLASVIGTLVALWGVLR